MSDEGKTIQPEHVFKRLIWRSTLASGEALERFTTWTIGGVAAVLGVMVSNVDSVAKIVSLNGIKTSILLFTLSLLAGALSKQLGMAVASGVNTLKQVEVLLGSDAGQELMSHMTSSPIDLVREMSEPFLWPLSVYMRKAGERGLTDYLSGDKRFVKMFCLQLAFNALHNLLAVAALLAIGLSI